MNHEMVDVRNYEIMERIFDIEDREIDELSEKELYEFLE